MNIKSASFEQQTPIPSKYTCDGENINPPLMISGAPEGTKSLALISDDPDAPGGTWVHWTVWNIDPRTAEIAENSVPEKAVEGTTSFGKFGYGGPCPPSGTHRYYFKLYALDTVLNIPVTATARDLKEAMKGHILADAQLMGTYSRNNQ